LIDCFAFGTALDSNERLEVFSAVFRTSLKIVLAPATRAEGHRSAAEEGQQWYELARLLPRLPAGG
jgi:hypothetical protein